MLEDMHIKPPFIRNARLASESKLAEDLGVRTFEVFLVQHSVPAFGLRINLKTDFSIVYSGTIKISNDFDRKPYHAVYL